MEEKIMICADVIAWYKGKIVLIERFTRPEGLALPGGKHGPNELLSQTAQREFLEETGMELEISEVFTTFADPGRDPRGRYISTIFVGKACGTPKNETGKTKVIFAKVQNLGTLKNRFVFDHWKAIEGYLKLSEKGGN